jgi:predicted nucleic acid-binding protein
MAEPIIVDTSVWIDFFKGKETDQVKIFSSYLENNDPVYVCPVVIQEVLQGIRSEKDYSLVKNYIFALNILNDDGIEVAIVSADIYRKLRQKGITLRKSNDCNIACYAIKYNFKIVHNDRDFDFIMQNL